MSGFVLRDYQEISVQKGVDFFNGKSKKNAVIVLPTGSGKSLVIANIAKRLKRSYYKPGAKYEILIKLDDYKNPSSLTLTENLEDHYTNIDPYTKII